MNTLLVRSLLYMYPNQLTRLCMSEFGCMNGHKYYDAVGYADYIFLIAPSIYALNKMCDICLEFAMNMIYNLTRQNVNLLNMEEYRLPILL